MGCVLVVDRAQWCVVGPAELHDLGFWAGHHCGPETGREEDGVRQTSLLRLMVSSNKRASKETSVQPVTIEGLRNLGVGT